MPEAPAFLKGAVANAPPTQTPQITLQELRAKVAQARDLERAKAELEERLKATNVALYDMLHKTLPDLFNEANTTSIEIAPEGNNPGFSAKAQPYYKASIQASWPPEQQQEAFDTLTAFGAEDLIKVIVETSFPRGQHEEAQEFAANCREQGYNVIVKEAVPWQTLTSWLKESVEKHNIIPPLDKIGGEVGRVVKLKELK